MINKSEFEKIIMSEDIVSLSLCAAIREQLFSINQAVRAMDGFEHRNPHHCYDLFEHTLHTVENVACDDIDSNDALLLKTAAFFHDIGKPRSVIEKPDRRVFYGHPKKSAETAEPILQELGYSHEDIAKILFYIKNHDMFISFVFPEENYDRDNKFIKVINDENIYDAIQTAAQKETAFTPVKTDFLLLLRLCEADAMAQSEFVYNTEGNIIDSRKHKLMKFKEIQKITEKI